MGTGPGVRGERQPGDAADVVRAAGGEGPARAELAPQPGVRLRRVRQQPDAHAQQELSEAACAGDAALDHAADGVPARLVQPRLHVPLQLHRALRAAHQWQRLPRVANGPARRAPHQPRACREPARARLPDSRPEEGGRRRVDQHHEADPRGAARVGRERAAAVGQPEFPRLGGSQSRGGVARAAAAAAMISRAVRCCTVLYNTEKCTLTTCMITTMGMCTAAGYLVSPSTIAPPVAAHFSAPPQALPPPTTTATAVRAFLFRPSNGCRRYKATRDPF